MNTEQRERDAPIICPYCAFVMRYHRRVNATHETYGVYICPKCESQTPPYVAPIMVPADDETIRERAYGRARRAANKLDLEFVKKEPDELNRAYLTALRDAGQEENCGTCRHSMLTHTEEPCKTCIKGKRKWQWRGWRVQGEGAR